MNWKDLLVGAIFNTDSDHCWWRYVYFFTSEKSEERHEELVFVRDTPTVFFKSGKTEVGLSQLRVANVGNLAAKEVKVVITFPHELIRDKKITLSSGDPTNYSVSEDSQKTLAFLVPALPPNETIQVSLLLASGDTPPPFIVVRSAVSLGQEAPS